MRKIKGIIIDKNSKWFVIKQDKYKSSHSDFMLINEYSSFLNKGDKFELYVESHEKQTNGARKWFHIPVNNDERATTIVLGVGVDNMIIQPCSGNVIVKADKAYKVKRVEKKPDGWSNGYFSDYWWKITCEDITNTERGKKAIAEQIK